MDILQHLSEDSAVREALIERIADVEALYDSVYQAEVQESAADTAELGADPVDLTEVVRQEVEDRGDAIETIMDELYQTEVVSFDLVDSPSELGEDFVAKFATVLLLSLGAPFWYKILNDFVGFRSVVARKQKDDETGSSDG